MTISFEIENQIIKRTDKNKVVADSRNYLFAEFSFTEEWTGTITAVFKKDCTAYAAVLDSENKCAVPWEVISEGRFSVSCFCGNRVTANKEYVTVIASGYEQGETPLDPTPDVYSSLVGLFESASQKADEVFTAYENGELKGEKGDTGAPAENQFPVLDWTSLSLADFARGGKIDACEERMYITSKNITVTLKNEAMVFTEPDEYIDFAKYMYSAAEPDLSRFVYSGNGTGTIPEGSLILIYKRDGNVVLSVSQLNLSSVSFPFSNALIFYNGESPLMIFSSSFVFESIEMYLNNTAKGNVNYSADEKRIGTWLDGKPLYEKSYSVTLPSTSTQTVLSAIDSSDFDLVTKLDAVIVQSNDSSGTLYVSTTPTGNSYYRTSNERLQLFFIRQNNNPQNGINVFCGSYFAGATAVITVNYTKLSDAGD